MGCGAASVIGCSPESDQYMSYILDALKKLEKEKTIKNRGSGMLNISGELFKEERRPSSRVNSWKIVVMILAASLATFGATWLFLNTGKTQNVATPQLSFPVSTSRPVSTQVMPEGSSPQAAATAKPQLPLPAQPDPVPVRQAVRPVVPVIEEAVPTEVEQQVKRKNIPKKQRASAPQKQPAVSTIPPPADIKVSGIAWQGDHRARRAVVNGFLMKEGGSVSGARIVEILQDRVRFSLDGRFFEVYLPASDFTGTTK